MQTVKCEIKSERDGKSTIVVKQFVCSFQTGFQEDIELTVDSNLISDNELQIFVLENKDYYKGYLIELPVKTKDGEQFLLVEGSEIKLYHEEPATFWQGYNLQKRGYPSHINPYEANFDLNYYEWLQGWVYAFQESNPEIKSIEQIWLDGYENKILTSAEFGNIDNPYKTNIYESKAYREGASCGSQLGYSLINHSKKEYELHCMPMPNIYLTLYNKGLCKCIRHQEKWD